MSCTSNCRAQTLPTLIGARLFCPLSLLPVGSNSNLSLFLLNMSPFPASATSGPKYMLFLVLKKEIWTSLVAQWLRIRLPMQGTQVRTLVQEDPTCRGATKPVHHNCWACALDSRSHNYWDHVPQLMKPACLEPVLRNKRSPPSATRESPRAATKTQCNQK